MKSIAVVCVLKSGGYFKEEHVLSLKKMIEDNTSVIYSFYCLSDVNIGGVNVILLKDDFVGWWSKIELFKYDLFKEQRIVYFDLDTVILQNIDNLLLLDQEFIGLTPFNTRRRLIENYIASGILSWDNSGLFSFIYDLFDYDKDPKKFRGDQDYISYILAKREFYPMRFQKLFNGIYSYKKHIRGQVSIPIHPKIICFHGNPRPDTVKLSYENISRK